MARKFTDARVLLHDLLDRYERGAERPYGYPDRAGFPSVSTMDAFDREVRGAEATGTVTLSYGKGRKRDEIRMVRLANPQALYAYLGRLPSKALADGALDRILDGLDLDPALLESAVSAAEAWSRKRTWCHLGYEDETAMRNALKLAQGIVEGVHVGQDYRTYSRRVTRNSKALERVETAVLRLVSNVVEVPPEAKPRAALAALGLERFSQPILLSGPIALDGTTIRDDLPYLGIPPREFRRIALTREPAYVLTIENFASYSRHVTETDPKRQGLVVYAGSYPSFDAQRALGLLSETLPECVPFFHWSDIDADGTWIFRTIESAVRRSLRPHLMSQELAEAGGMPNPRPGRLKRGSAEGSMISTLVDYLSDERSKTMEQEEVDPEMPKVPLG
ncbi:hypothetical protein HBA54_20515 [Pelagibius litoralis]|uniref:Wadjet protein JetD C-terminal domain-containing protein n=1 Tax=Pelagibius litoralis TaxID=374515 RepID=A0A967F0U0_9PROT|nr:Wadjet anti-phage system protein JetD domain-containing protein [Pelagibius litoralis]NIA70987.1 hypothetical protein [Pelagibius litoralis]